MSKLLVVGHYWNEDVDYLSTKISTSDEWEAHLSAVEELFAETEYSLSTGEWDEIEYESFDDYKSTFRTYDISDKEVAFLRKVRLADLGNDLTLDGLV